MYNAQRILKGIKFKGNEWFELDFPYTDELSIQFLVWDDDKNMSGCLQGVKSPEDVYAYIGITSSWERWKASEGGNISPLAGKGMKFLHCFSSRGVNNEGIYESRINFSADKEVPSFQINGVGRIELSSLSTVYSSKGMRIGCFHNLYGGEANEDFFSGNLHFFRILDKNDKVIAELRPYRDENNIVCLYDFITDKTFYNQSGTTVEGIEFNYPVKAVGNLWNSDNKPNTIEISGQSLGQLDFSQLDVCKYENIDDVTGNPYFPKDEVNMIWKKEGDVEPEEITPIFPDRPFYQFRLDILNSVVKCPEGVTASYTGLSGMKVFNTDGINIFDIPGQYVSGSGQILDYNTSTDFGSFDNLLDNDLNTEVIRTGTETLSLQWSFLSKQYIKNMEITPAKEGDCLIIPNSFELYGSDDGGVTWILLLKVDEEVAEDVTEQTPQMYDGSSGIILGYELDTMSLRNANYTIDTELEFDSSKDVIVIDCFLSLLTNNDRIFQIGLGPNSTYWYSLGQAVGIMHNGVNIDLIYKPRENMGNNVEARNYAINAVDTNQFRRYILTLNGPTKEFTIYDYRYEVTTKFGYSVGESFITHSSIGLWTLKRKDANGVEYEDSASYAGAAGWGNVIKEYTHIKDGVPHVFKPAMDFAQNYCVWDRYNNRFIYPRLRSGATDTTTYKPFQQNNSVFICDSHKGNLAYAYGFYGGGPVHLVGIRVYDYNTKLPFIPVQMVNKYYPIGNMCIYDPVHPKFNWYPYEDYTEWTSDVMRDNSYLKKGSSDLSDTPLAIHNIALNSLTDREIIDNYSNPVIFQGSYGTIDRRFVIRFTHPSKIWKIELFCKKIDSVTYKGAPINTQHNASIIEMARYMSSLGLFSKTSGFKLLSINEITWGATQETWDQDERIWKCTMYYWREYTDEPLGVSNDEDKVQNLTQKNYHPEAKGE